MDKRDNPDLEGTITDTTRTGWTDGSVQYDHEQYRIVFVDDDADVLRATTRILKRDKWQIVPFTDPREAVAYVKANQNRETPIALVLTDTNMPGIDGTQVIEQVKAYDPAIRAIIMTGELILNNELYASLESKVGKIPLLEKPAGIKDLQAVVKNEIDIYHRNRSL